MEDHEAIFYTVQQVARRYGVSTRVIYEALQRGYIKGVRLGGRHCRSSSAPAASRAGELLYRKETRPHKGFSQNGWGTAGRQLDLWLKRFQSDKEESRYGKDDCECPLLQ